MNIEKCCFCLGDITQKESVTILKCNHKFHMICLDQYQKSLCPLCRQEKIIEKQNICNTDIKKYKDDEYLWIFGTFVPILNPKRKNYLIFKQGNKKTITGYFWRLFDSDTSEILEKLYNEYNNDNSKNNVHIEIGSLTYKLHFNNNNYSIENHIDNNDKIVECIQENNINKFRPILRMTWKDINNNLLLIGIHDNKFFNNKYIYCKYNNDKEYYLFNFINQQQINEYYSNNINLQKINIDDTEYFVNILTNTIVNKKNKIIHKIHIFDKQNIINY